MQKYREFVLANMEQIRNEIRSGRNKLNICHESFRELPTEEMYKQLVLYMDQVVIPDPLFCETETKSTFSNAAAQMMGFSPSGSVDREKICRAIEYFMQIEPLIDAGFVVTLPLSFMHEGPKNIPITYSPTSFSDVIPREILDYFRSIARVHNLVPVEKGYQIIDDKPLELGTNIYVDFLDGERLAGSAFQYFISKVFEYDESTGKAVFGFRPADSITIDEFSAWVNQSVNQAANGHFQELYKELVFSQSCGCMYLSRSNIVSKVLDMAIGQPGKDAELAKMALSMELPITSNIPTKDLLSIRNDYGEAFHNFRTELNSQLLKLDTCDDNESLRRQIDAISYEMNNTQVQEVEKEYRKIARTLKLDALALSGSLVASYTTGGITAIGAAAAIVKGFSDVAKYYTDVREHNGFFLWKVNKLAEKYSV